MKPVFPFNHFDITYSETIIKGDDGSAPTVGLLCSITNKLLTSIKFEFGTRLPLNSMHGARDTDRANFMMYCLQNLSSWLIYGEAVINVQQPDVPLTGAFDPIKGEWYVLSSDGSRLYESQVMRSGPLRPDEMNHES